MQTASRIVGAVPVGAAKIADKPELWTWLGRRIGEIALSGHFIGAMPMTVSQATAEVFLIALRALPAEERQAVLAHIAEDEEWQEDLKDLAVFSQRRTSRPAHSANSVRNEARDTAWTLRGPHQDIGRAGRWQAFRRRLSRSYRRRILVLESNPRPQGCKKLSGREEYRLRVGDYRVLYVVNDAAGAIEVVAVGNRKDVYRR